MSLVKPPHPDGSLEPFRDGVGVLRQDGAVVGHVATTLSEFWSPFSPLRRQWWVWLIVVWADGKRERSTEDYSPWTYVAEMKAGRFEWTGGGHRDGVFDFEWLSPDEAHRVRAELNVTPDDF